MKETKISIKDIVSGDDIGIAADGGNRKCAVCGKEESMSSRRLGDIFLDGDNIVIKWYYICKAHREKMGDFLGDLRKQSIETNNK